MDSTTTTRTTTACLLWLTIVILPAAADGPPPASATEQPAERTGAPANNLDVANAELERFIPTAEQLRAAERPGRRGRSRDNVVRMRITPHWSDDGTHFWYHNDLRDGGREFILVDAEQGMRRKAFDHDRMAQAMADAGLDANARRLPMDQLQFDLADDVLTFRAAGQMWKCNLTTYELTQLEVDHNLSEESLPARAPDDAPQASTRTGTGTELTFVNQTSGEVELYWRDSRGQRQRYATLSAGESRTQPTYDGHVWEIVDGDGNALAVFEAAETPSVAEITGRVTSPPRGRQRPRRRPPPRNVSPDGRWRALIQDHNVYIRPLDAEQSGNGQEEIRLSDDGSEGFAYDMLQWAPDSKTLVAFRVEPSEIGEVYLIESSPEGGGRARLHRRTYALPGDKFASYELNLFHVDERRQTKVDVDPIDFGRPRLRWRDERYLSYEKVDRGHQRFRVIEVDSHTGQSRNIVDEQTETFIWTAHGPDIRITTYLDRTEEMIYASEQDGWRHLYLVDMQTGSMQPITRGEWVVRGIDRVDEENRQIWFRASGKNPDQDPYFIHYYRVNFDGSELVTLTEGDGQHSVQFSPDREYLIATYSRVDMPPVHELRRTSDGSLVCELERADISQLAADGWQPPEVFVAKGRDGETDIWGIICRPSDFDPEKKYPVIEYIYAGPHGSFVPKTFSATRRFSALTDRGFVVVQIDGMGTANRCKAFHDVCWQNLGDAGLPDRILWHQAVAEKYPWYDTDRVGIYGNSAGGQSSTGALLFHPEFYKVAVSSCGCHDNRMDKASWNEQWMGYPVGPHYAESSNIENAHRLQGKLLLIVGEMDTNVPPESTLRLADALIKANKDFDLLVIPGGGHGMGGSYGQRRMQDFFVRHLHGVEPPDRNAPGTQP